MLFVQGTRDTFGTADELASVLAQLAPPPRIHPVAGGDHSFRVSKKPPTRQAETDAGIQRTIAAWIRAGGT
jgi:predicted alpha/beta-hydrolase family hydrolase